MVSEIYLIRHGLVDYANGKLNGDGRRFSADLVSILGEKGIQFIGCDIADTGRCLKTILPLAERKGIEYREFTFKDGLPLTALDDRTTVAFCYRYESFKRIQCQLGLEIPGPRNETYEYIYHVAKQEDGAWSLREKIPTGFKGRNCYG